MAGVTEELIRLATALIPAKGLRRRVRRRLLDRARDRRTARLVPVVRARYAEHERRVRGMLERGERVRVAFLVCDAAMFSAESVFLAMRGDARFDCSIAVVPRVTRGEAFLRETLAKALGTLGARYGAAVRPLYDPDSRAALPLEADVVFTSIVYSEQTLAEYTALSLSERALVACITYGYSGLFRVNAAATIFQPEIALMWRYFVSNPQTLALWTERNPLLRETARLSGYAKMDRLASVPRRADRPKTVIIAPHHSLPRPGAPGGGLTLSNFLSYADLFLRLPKDYPDVRFVFRPHPLLMPRLATRAWWGEEKTAAYCAAMEALPNVEFQRGGDYFETFANSDALIHDCGSFLAEYFYTGRPQCYLLADRLTEEREFLPFGRETLERTYKAYCEADIRAFVEDVVMRGHDPRRAEREAFAAANVCCHYPHAAERVVDEVLESIQRDDVA